MSTPGDDADLAENLIALSLAVERLRGAICRELELTPQQVQFLCALAHGDQTSGALAVLLACDKTNITGLVKRLEARHLVERIHDESDHRIVRIALAEDGRTVVERFRGRAARVFASQAADWAVADRRAVSRAARKALNVLAPDLAATVSV